VCVVGCWSVLYCVTECCSWRSGIFARNQMHIMIIRRYVCVVVCYIVLQSAAACCSALQCVAQRVAMCF